jgi:3'-5' exoribonuclease
MQLEQEQGKVTTGSYLIDKISVNEHYLELELNNGTTKISGILKDNIDLFSKTYSIGDRVICKGRIRKRRKHNCLDIIYISKNMLDPQINTKFDSDLLVNKFHDLMSSIVDVDYKKVLDNCFNDDVKELFFTYPAAKANHHNYVHGLLQHSIEVVDICLFLAERFKANRDLLVCAGLLHDIGKLKSYDIDGDFKKIVKTDWDQLLGHLSISALFVSKITPSDIDQNKIMLLYHMLLSHHGELSHGSPILCKTKEAYILYRADELSSTLNHVDLLNYTGSWSAEDKITNRSWFRSNLDA